MQGSFIKFGYEDVNHGTMTFDLSNMSGEEIDELFKLKDTTRSRLWNDMYYERNDIPYTTEYNYTEESKRYDHRLIECSPDLQGYVDGLIVRNTFYEEYKEKVDERNVDVRKDLDKLVHLIDTLDVVTGEMEDVAHELKDKLVVKNYLPTLHLMNPLECGRKYHDDVYYAVRGRDLNMMGGIVYPSIKDENNFIVAHVDSESLKHKLESIESFDEMSEERKYKFVRDIVEDDMTYGSLTEDVTEFCCNLVHDSVLSTLNPFSK